MTKTKAVVTVGMPAYNSVRTLRRAVESVLSQDFDGWTLLISDDVSTDDTWALCQELARADARITARRSHERRMYMNFGDLLAQAGTPYFAWLAADDFWAPTFLSKCLEALAQHRSAVSALPRCEFVGGGRAPSTETLDGPRIDRLRRYLAHPGGTRMYGLCRTEKLRSAFPPRNMNAYDWYLMMGLLGQGPQVEVPEVLLFREETHWMNYSEVVDQFYRSPLWRRFPVLDMSLAAWRAGFVPRENLGDLVALNLRKHEEYLAVMRPRAYARRAWLFRRLGLPMSTKPGNLAAVATELVRRDPERRAAALNLLRQGTRRGDASLTRALARVEAESRLAAPATIASHRPTAGSLPALTAVLACRNASSTLPRLLDHMERIEARVVLIDHSSTDGTRRIAESRRGSPVVNIVEQPFDGTFDLGRQLAMKREVIGSIGTGWVIHADGDEFLDPPPGRTLRQAVVKAEEVGHLAFPCREFLFLPGTEAERHSSESFEATLCTYVPLAERDPKQRLFRHDAPFDLWMATGGHTVTLDPARLATEALDLRHYFGLSLADIRGQYYSRVFSERDLAKRWHGGRLAATHLDIVAPPAGSLRDRAAVGLDPSGPVRVPPVFSPAAPSQDPEAAAPADLILLAASGAGSDHFASLLEREVRGLRVRRLTELTETCWRSLPVLHLIEHPARVGDGCPSDLGARASAWVRRIAQARQTVLRPGPAYLEMRLEDCTSPAQLATAVSALVLGNGPRGRAGYLPLNLPALSAPWPDAVRSTAGPLARDLGYE